MDMLKILKFKSDFLHSKFIVWTFGLCTYVDYSSNFNNPYTNFHLSKYWKNIYIFNFVFFYIQTLKDDKSYMWVHCFTSNVVKGANGLIGVTSAPLGDYFLGNILEKSLEFFF